MNMVARIRLGMSFTVLFSVSLGLLTAACSVGRCSIVNLFIPAVTEIALGISLAIGLLLAPLGIWAAKTGGKNLRKYGFAFWLIFAISIVLGFRRINSLLELELVASVIVLIILGMIPNRG